MTTSPDALSTDMLSTDIAVLTFEARGGDGVIAALHDLIARNVIRVIELGFVERSPDGVVRTLDHGDALGNGTGAAPLMAGTGLAAANRLEPGTTAMVVVWENIWADRLTTALRDARGVLVESTSSVFDTCSGV